MFSRAIHRPAPSGYLLLASLLFAAVVALGACSSGGDSQQTETAAGSSVQTPAPQTESTAPVILEDSERTTPAESSSESVELEEPDSIERTEAPDSHDESPDREENALEAVVDEEPTPVADEVAEEAEEEQLRPVESVEPRAYSVEDTKPGLTRVGAENCKLCHKIQYASWAESQHAKRSPALDCESCHGSGSEYKKKSIMQDPALARAAGLVIPDAGFCRNCHAEEWNEDMLSRAHAHKEQAND